MINWLNDLENSGGLYVESVKQNQFSHEKSIMWVIAASYLGMFVNLMAEPFIRVNAGFRWALREHSYLLASLKTQSDFLPPKRSMCHVSRGRPGPPSLKATRACSLPIEDFSSCCILF